MDEIERLPYHAKLFENLIEQSPSCIVVLDQTTITYANSQFMQLIDSKAKVINTAFEQFIHPSYVHYFKNWLQQIMSGNIASSIELILLKDEHFPLKVEIRGASLQKSHLIQLLINDRSQIPSQTLTELPYVRHEDEDLLSRELVLDHLKHAIQLTNRKNTHLVLMYLVMNKLKFIHDTYGRRVGDLILQHITERLKSVMAQNISILILGADKFLVLMHDIADTKQTDTFINRFTELLMKPFLVNDNHINVTVTAGISIYPDNGLDAETLLQNAKAAYLHAQQNDNVSFQFFTQGMAYQMKERAELLYDLRHAIKNNELQLHYQPVVNVKTAKVIALEALLRWHRLQQYLLLPRDFLSLAEETGLIFGITDWIIQTACYTNLQLQEKNIKPLPISINLSLRQFESENDLLETIQNVLSVTQLSAASLEFEMSGNVTILDVATDLITKIKALGIKLTIDNFGASFFSLNELQEYQIDNIKVDQTLITQLPENKDVCSMVNAIIALANQLGVTVIAEGIETKEQYDYLIEQGCYLLQGNYICPPLTADKIGELLQAKVSFPIDMVLDDHAT